VAVIQRVEMEVALSFECNGCGFSSPVQVLGRGFANGPWETEGLSERAHASAVKSARMRCELAPCPVCGQRRFDLFRRAATTTIVFLVAFVAVCAGVYYVSDSRSFMHDLGTTVALYAGMLGLGLAWVGFSLVREIRGAPGKVRFPPDVRGSGSS
jgi:hypothetical protein